MQFNLAFWTLICVQETDLFLCQNVKLGENLIWEFITVSLHLETLERLEQKSRCYSGLKSCDCSMVAISLKHRENVLRNNAARCKLLN